MAALVSGRRGEIYVPKMGSARMIDLASAIIDGRDIPVRHTGVRPGEKIHEVIVSEEECARTIERGDYYVVAPMLPECAPERPVTPVMTREYSSEDVTLDQAGIRALLRRDRESRRRVPAASVNTDTHRGATNGHP
jgi:FlaA1/EpsC-like NDP-sugar epimerase